MASVTPGLALQTYLTNRENRGAAQTDVTNYLDSGNYDAEIQGNVNRYMIESIGAKAVVFAKDLKEANSVSFEKELKWKGIVKMIAAVALVALGWASILTGFGLGLGIAAIILGATLGGDGFNDYANSKAQGKVIEMANLYIRSEKEKSDARYGEAFNKLQLKAAGSLPRPQVVPSAAASAPSAPSFTVANF